ncbi:MAG: ABC transporter ATP-binding protein [Aquisalimonadaceae bacterium]
MLQIRNLSLAYGKAEPVLEGVDLDLEPGRFVSLIGPSGCGKSTILRVVTGLQKPDTGRVSLKVDHKEIAFLFQDDALLPWRSVRDNVALGLRARGMSRQEARTESDKWLDSVGLTGFGDRWPRQLSGGQRKRVAIAQCLALRPKLLLMDEPFASLDAIVRHYLTEDLLHWVEREHLTVLMVTHDLEEAIALSDEVILLGSGPRAHIKGRFEVPLERPRMLLENRSDPRFVKLAKQLWSALSDEVAPLMSRRSNLKAVNQ